MAFQNELVDWLKKNKLSQKEAAAWLPVELQTLRGWIYEGHEPSAIELLRARMGEFKTTKMSESPEKKP